jgi:arylformamidase
MTRFDPAWLDAQYNNRARIPEHAAIFARWARASELARERSACHLDIAYGPHPAETLDVFPAVRSVRSANPARSEHAAHTQQTTPATPATPAGAPVLVFIHGGWWRSLDKRDHAFIAPAFTHAGAMVVVPNYALCPAVTIETIALQMTRALAWVHAHAAQHGGDARRIVVAGHSAGGNLAAMLLCCEWRAVAPRLPARLVIAALSISGVFDLEPLRHAPFLQADLRLTAAMARRSSPARFAAPADTLYATVGALESDEFLRQNRLIRSAWGERAVPVCECVAGANHLTVLHDLADPSTRLHGLALHLLGLADAPAAEG